MEIHNLIMVAARKLINTGQKIQSKHWQGTELKNPMFQAIKVYLGPAQMPGTMEALASETKANLPWAEAHFQERVSGIPSNPGEQYKNWPYWNNQKEMMVGEKFSHTYQERFWPKYAGVTNDEVYERCMDYYKENGVYNKGIRYDYGDLIDVINLLIKDPETRQAYLPIWFPEDTGAVHGGRVPCSLGYLFQIVDNVLHMTYYIRSCDFIRHFRDDIYMAIRLAQYIQLALMVAKPEFKKLTLGTYDMTIGSLHVFHHEVTKIKKEFDL